jgi:hypothetical protein
MNYNVTVKGQAAQVTLNPDGKGGLTGQITHTQYGDGQISATQNGNALEGRVTLDGHDAVFKATINGHAIAGTITPTGFLGAILGSSSFTGSQAA